MPAIAISDLTNAQLVALYNHVSLKPVKRFENRPTAEKRVTEALEKSGRVLDEVASALGILDSEAAPPATDEPVAVSQGAEDGELVTVEPDTTDEGAIALPNDVPAEANGAEPEDEDGEDEQSVDAIMRRNAERLAAADAEAANAAPVDPDAQEDDAQDESEDNGQPDPAEQPAPEAPEAPPAAAEGEPKAEGEADESEGEERQFVFALPCTPAQARKVAAELARIADAAVYFSECECSAVMGGRMVEPPARSKKPQAASTGEPRARKPRNPDRDWTVKPVITSASNAHVQKVIDRIAEARGDAEKLRTLDTFSRSSTYYRMAGQYLDALLAEASAAATA